MSDLSPLPILPSELEKEIFDIAAYSRPLCIPKLMLVAWRVRIWVEPLLYRVVILLNELDHICLDGMKGYPYEDEKNFTRIRATPASVLRDSVRHLCLKHVSNEVAEFILSASSGVEDLWIIPNGTAASLLLILGLLPLKCLYCSLGVLFAPDTVDFTHPLFSHLTHLEFFDWNPVFPEHWFRLSLIPHLTHLGFNHKEFLRLALTILNTCKSLRVLVFLESPWATSVEEHPELEDLAKDPRFVQMPRSQYIKDWQMGALTDIDYWSRAEEFIAKRKMGEINPLQYLIEVDESKNLV
ncbi:hypothetical protein B0H11DRAFT_2206111 [Mycena galericulata]|nr:hypothetical protein B0H11DRAFT_2206111 [Mycena galericulata]